MRSVRGFLSAAEAAAELSVSLPTLYAYVSRGLIRSEGEAGSRRRRYAAEDVWLLRERRQNRRDPAKTARDAMLVALDREYPMYGFARHKGYGTPEHLAALELHGPCPHHRRSFAPVLQSSFDF